MYTVATYVTMLHISIHTYIIGSYVGTLNTHALNSDLILFNFLSHSNLLIIATSEVFHHGTVMKTNTYVAIHDVLDIFCIMKAH